MVSTSLPAPAGSGSAGAGAGRPRGGAAPAPPRLPSPGAAAPTDPRSGGGGGTEAQEAEQEASPASAFSWGSGVRGGAASGAREPPPPPRWGECAAPRVGRLPRSGLAGSGPRLCVWGSDEGGGQIGADDAPAEWLGGLAARVPPPVPCPRRPPAVCREQTGKHRKRRMVGVRAEREDEPS